MKIFTIVLIVCNGVLVYLLYGSHLEIDELKRQTSLLRMEVSISESIREDAPKMTVDLHCHAMQITEQFGDFNTWIISIKGMAYDVKGNSLVFRNTSQSSILKTWHPPREAADQQSGFGNSVSTAVPEYRLALLDQKRLKQVVYNIERIDQLCK